MQRKFLPLLLVLMMVFSLLGFNPKSYAFELAEFDGGFGTESQPWQIATVEQLNNVRNYLGPEHDDKHFILTANIDLDIYPYNTGRGWVPIGDWYDWYRNYFYGSFDGDYHTISGLFINISSDNEPAGLFGEVYNATIKNITLSNVNVTGFYDVGGLAGDAIYSIITGADVSGTISGTSGIGGLIGYAFGSYIADTSFTGTVNGEDSVGGLIGYLDGCAVRNSSSSGEVEGYDKIGGLVGYNYKGSIFKSYSDSSVAGLVDSYRIGGLVGESGLYSTIDRSYATGDVTGLDNLGGLVGESSNFCKITNSYALGNVSSTVDDDFLSVGGLVGAVISSTVENCYATGIVSGTGEWHSGLVGYESSYSSITNSYSFGPDNGTGTIVTEDQMKTQSTFIEWDFEDIWGIDEYSSYPFLLTREGDAEIESFLHNSTISVTYGTPLTDVGFPLVTYATLDDNTIVPLQVTWDKDDPTYDGNTAGSYTFTGTIKGVAGVANTGGHTASIAVTVMNPPQEIIGVGALADIFVPLGTDYYYIDLPSTVVVTLEDNSTTSLEVYWGYSSVYNGNIAGEYVLTGTINTNYETTNSNEHTASVKVIVGWVAEAAPVITDHPEDLSVKVGEKVTFSVGYTAEPEPNFQWQFSKNGGKKWNNISGANSSIYEVTQATIGMNGYQYRVLINNGVGLPAISNAARLTVTYGTANISISQHGQYLSESNEIVWYITVTNHGPETAQGVVIKNSLASNTNLISVDSEYDYSLKGKTININVGEMEISRHTVVEIRVLVTRVKSPTTNTATVSSTSLDEDLTDNTSTYEIWFQ